MFNFCVFCFCCFLFNYFSCIKLQRATQLESCSKYKKTDKLFINDSTFLFNNYSSNKNVNRNNYKLFYKSKSEKQIHESGYLYPFDHLEKKKKKFPPDPYVLSDEEREEKAREMFDDKINDDDDMLSYDDEEDAKKYFGKTIFSKLNALQQWEEGQADGQPDDQTDCQVDTHEDDQSDGYSTDGNGGMVNHDYISKVEKHNHNAEVSTKKKIERQKVNITFYISEENKIECEMMKDQVYYLFHSSMDNAFIECFELHIDLCIIPRENIISVSYNFENINYKTAISSLSDLIDFCDKLKKILQNKIDTLYYNEEKKEDMYLSKYLKKELEINKKERNVTNLSKKNLQMSIESSLKLIEKCKQKLYKQNYELTLHDLKQAYNMLPCKYYGFFISNLCSNISVLSYYTNDLQGTFNFALKSIKYEPKYSVAWKCLGDAYRSFRNFWQAKNFYDIAIYLGYKDNIGEDFEEIVQELNNLVQSALKNVDILKENMNNATNIVIKKNIGIVLNKNPDSIGGCYVSYIIEGSKASKKNFHHGDQIVALNSIITYGKPIDHCLKAFQKNDGSYDIIFFKGNIIELYGLKAYKYLIKNDLFYTLFENEKISSFKRNEAVVFDMKGFGTFSEYGMSKGGN
ncbi:conserved Plasmodium protein, unknown function [Plasmodium malariae]|uniref:PDZ domain-containing protein n=1 Tax=Plasmodium malariae TaxID=5858 RepID=A0A1C3KYR1_PLAMA|nr:conserved Plasmodium protein, unknown function [Plasmodium malariae]